ncbi:helix-turn-helix domain-containing protein [Candidatus Bathyarchaeota archaeon A05DMB-2]|jgi:putative transcriptional regulator|nr:helix-turn-helix domain-containing protein [Candidatus Bathyarchaeota archaeon A05DMB-2]
MNHWEMENAVQLGVALKEAGFQISQICCSRPSCFDFAAGKNGRTLLVKVNSDVDTFNPKDSRELRAIASSISAASLVISQQTHGKPLQDDTVYSRYGVFVVTEKTLKAIALETANPLIYASPGGYTVEIDGKLVEKRRKELGMSVGKLAEKIGVSRRTLYGYERGMTRASVTSAYKLAETLGVPVAKPINVLEPARKQRQCLLMKARYAFAGKAPLLQKIFRKFAFCDISPVHKAPFDFILKVPRSRCVIVGCVAIDDERNLNYRMKETISFCQVAHARPVLITENHQPPSKDISCVCMDELAVMRTPEDLVASV